MQNNLIQIKMKKIKIASAIIIGSAGVWAGVHLFWNTDCSLWASFFLYVSGLILIGVGCSEWEHYLKGNRNGEGV